MKSVANAEMTTRGTVMATARMGPAQGECTGRVRENAFKLEQQNRFKGGEGPLSFLSISHKHKPIHRFQGPQLPHFSLLWLLEEDPTVL